MLDNLYVFYNSQPYSERFIVIENREVFTRRIHNVNILCSISLMQPISIPI